MRDETVSRSYADALFELARKEDRLEEYGSAMETVSRLLAENPDAKRFLETPRIGAADKKAVLREAFGDRFPRPVLNFLQVTVDKRRQRLLQQIADAYHDLLDEHLGRVHVEVTVAREFGDEQVQVLTGALSELLGKRAVPHVRVRPEILGGIVVRAGDTIYDGSLRRKMAGMRRLLLAAALHEDRHAEGPAEAG